MCRGCVLKLDTVEVAVRFESSEERTGLSSFLVVFPSSDHRCVFIGRVEAFADTMMFL